MKDFEKRKPEYASANFWGGKSKEWKNGSKVDVEKEGWLDEMCRKTLIREVYSPKHILLDPRKIDENYQYMREREAELQRTQDNVQQIIDVTANSVPIEEAAAQIPQNKPQELPNPAPKAIASPPQTRAGIEPQPTPTPSSKEPEETLANIEPPDAPIPEDGDLYAGMDF